MFQRAFSLIELLVVISIIGILSALVIPSVNGALKKSRDSKSASNLRQIGVALNGYAADNADFFPKARATIPYQAEDSDPSTWPWQQQLDPYVAKARKIFECPNAPDIGYGYYLGSRAAYLETNGFGGVNRTKIRELSKHILGGECLYWTGTTTDADKDDYMQTPSFQSDGSKGILTPILFADGHVQSFDHFDAAVMSARYEGVGEGNEYPWSP